MKKKDVFICPSRISVTTTFSPLPESDEVEEGGEGARRVVPHVLELGHEFLAEFVVDHGDLQRRRHVGQEVAVVSRLKVKLQICSI